MMRWIPALLLLAAPLGAQDAFPPDASGGGGGGYDGGSVSSPFLGPDGACAPGNPTYSWTSSPTAGWYKQPDTAVTKNQFAFCLEAGTYGAAGPVLTFARADNGVGQTRTHFRVWDPDAPTQVAGFLSASSSKWTTATTMTLRVFDTADTGVSLASSTSLSKVEIGDYDHQKDGFLTLIGGPTGADTYILFSPYNGVDFFQTTLDVVYPTANRTITLPDASGTVLLGGSTFLAPDGTKSAPAFSFTSDTDTGIFHEADHEINFTSNSEEIIETRYNGSSSVFNFYNIANTTAGDFGFSYTGSSASSTFYVSIPAVAGFAHIQLGGGTTTGGQITLGSPAVGNKLYFYASDTLANAIRWETDLLGTDYTDVVPAAPSGVNTLTLPAATGTVLVGGGTNTITLGTVAFAALGTPANGTLVYCSDCGRGTTPCAGGGSGSMAKREAGAWYCD